MIQQWKFGKEKEQNVLPLLIVLEPVHWRISVCGMMEVYAFPRQIWVCSSAYWTPVKANHSSGRNVNFSVTYVLHENYNVEVLIHPQRQEFKISSSWKCVNFHVYTLSNEFIYKLGLNPEHGDTTVIRFC